MKKMPGRYAWLWCLRTLALAVPAPHAPAALADDEALRLSATAPAAAWELGPTAQVNWTCGAGRRNADASECLAAVVAATRRAANGHIELANSAGVPPGCSYSRVSGAAMFNAGAGQVGSDKENYQLVCTVLGDILEDVSADNGCWPSPGFPETGTVERVTRKNAEEGGEATHMITRTLLHARTPAAAPRLSPCTARRAAPTLLSMHCPQV